MSSPAAAYAELLQQQNAAVLAFAETLQRERDILLGRSPVAHEALNELTAAKMRQAQQLQLLEQRRLQLAAAVRTGTHRGDEQLAQDLGCSALWQTLRRHVAQARAQNERNGAAIQTRLQSTQERLRFLRRSSTDGLYGADGQRQQRRSPGRSHGGA